MLGDAVSTDFPLFDPFQGAHGEVPPPTTANQDAFIARVPEPAASMLGFASLAVLGLLARRRPC